GLLWPRRLNHAWAGATGPQDRRPHRDGARDLRSAARQVPPSVRPGSLDHGGRPRRGDPRQHAKLHAPDRRRRAPPPRPLALGPPAMEDSPAGRAPALPLLRAVEARAAPTVDGRLYTVYGANAVYRMLSTVYRIPLHPKRIQGGGA